MSISLGRASVGAIEKESYIRKALEEAKKKGVIVCAAAGQLQQEGNWRYAGGAFSPAFPGRDPNAICVAGCKADHTPMPSGFLGSEVDVSAGFPPVGGSQQAPFCRIRGLRGLPAWGTSYATAITAGACALWQAYHGREWLLDPANCGPELIFKLFKEILKRSTHKPPGWDSTKRGVGVLDVEARSESPCRPRPRSSPSRTTSAMADRFLDGLVWFFQPLLEAVGDEVALRNLFGEFGYDLDGPAAANALRRLAPPCSRWSTNCPPQSRRERSIAAAACRTSSPPSLFSPRHRSRPDARGRRRRVRPRAVRLLGAPYLATLIYPASAALKALGVITFTIVAPTDPGGRDFPYRRVELRWGRLGDFIRYNGAWARDVYGWGSSTADGRTFDYCAGHREPGPDRRVDLPGAVTETTAAGTPKPTPSWPTTAGPLLRRSRSRSSKPMSPASTGTRQPTCQNEVGLKVVPLKRRRDPPRGVGPGHRPVHQRHPWRN